MEAERLFWGGITANDCFAKLPPQKNLTTEMRMKPMFNFPRLYVFHSGFARLFWGGIILRGDSNQRYVVLHEVK